LLAVFGQLNKIKMILNYEDLYKIVELGKKQQQMKSKY